VTPHIQQLENHFGRLALKLWRGTGIQVAEFLKQGEVELAIAGPLEDPWERIDRWPLFVETFVLVVQHGHKLANNGSITLEDLKHERLIWHRNSESEKDILSVLRNRGIDTNQVDEVATEFDQIKLIESNIGIAFLAESTALGQQLTRLALNDVELHRTVYLYGVAGRQRTPAAATIMKMLRGADWRKKH
jgi:DNA-binding transcriptional LysR family regulator